MTTSSMPPHNRVAYSAADVDAVDEACATHPEALVIYFNRDCDGCRAQRGAWWQSGLFEASNVYFVEYNGATHDRLVHVGAIPSYEKRRSDGTRQWQADFPSELRTIQQPPSPEQRTLVCNAVPRKEG